MIHYNTMHILFFLRYSPAGKPGVSLKLHSASSDEDPYSLSPSGSSGSSGQGPRQVIQPSQVQELSSSFDLFKEPAGYYGPQNWGQGQDKKKPTSRGRSKQNRKQEAIRQGRLIIPLLL